MSHPSLRSFSAALEHHGLPSLVRSRPRVVQINVGKLCNQACHHCHVEAGPGRKERMSAETARAIVERLGRSRGIEVVDLTGGAPELNDQFRYLVESSRRLDLSVVDRCNVTVLFEPGMGWLSDFLAEHRVRLICSLPCYTGTNVDAQRGQGVFTKSIAGLRLLNTIGYGRADSTLVLDLVYNPLGPTLPPPQAELAERYRDELLRNFGIEFHELLTITNMPIKRFADRLLKDGMHDDYIRLLIDHFNPATVAGLMCRDLVSVGWDGSLYDCDFHQMRELPLCRGEQALTIDTIEDFDELAGLPIQTAQHCFGCTAGAGSSCGGAIERP